MWPRAMVSRTAALVLKTSVKTGSPPLLRKRSPSGSRTSKGTLVPELNASMMDWIRAPTHSSVSVSTTLHIRCGLWIDANARTPRARPTAAAASRPDDAARTRALRHALFHVGLFEERPDRRVHDLGAFAERVVSRRRYDHELTSREPAIDLQRLFQGCQVVIACDHEYR